MKLSSSGLGLVLLIVVAVVGGACGFGGRPPPSPPRTAKLGLEVSSTELPNGLRVVLVHDPRATEVQVTMRYQVGAIDEPADQLGVAHLVEHLMFQQVLGGQTLFAKLESIATSFNAATTFDTTTYFARAQPSHLDELLSLDAVRIGFRCTSITASAFEREREVVVNELRQRDATSELWTALHEGVYPAGHPYHRALAGSEASVGALTRDQACAFADAHYTTTNAVLVVSGPVTAERVVTGLGKFLARVARRTAVPRTTVPAAVRDAPGKARTTATAPIDDPLVMVTWPLPRDPSVRQQLEALAEVMRETVAPYVQGKVGVLPLGGGLAPTLALYVIAPDPDDLEPGEHLPTTDETLKGITRGLEDLPLVFHRLHGSTLTELSFDQIQQTAIYKAYTELEDGSERDQRLADQMLAGVAPQDELASEFARLRELSPEFAVQLINDHLSFARGHVVVFEPREEVRRGRPIALGAAIHDLGQRRDPPDPAEAHQPAPASVVPTLGAELHAGLPARGLPSISQLSNGLRVVLLPLTSVPTVDARLVFAAGSGDDLPRARGASLVAGYALTWDLRHIKDYLLFAAAGGESSTEVGFDHTAFTVRGVDMHLDLLLAALRRRVRDGRYGSGAQLTVDALHQAAANPDEERRLAEPWRVARFGAGHPYVFAGQARHVSDELTMKDVIAFRAAHLTPDNATLVISGGFDPAVATRWVEYLFGGWQGHAAPRTSISPAPAPASLAQRVDTSQTALFLSLPASSDGRPSRLVAAAMLELIADDVRHQLGASYGLHVTLDQNRLAVGYLLSGSVDAVRTSEAVGLLRTRLAELATDPDTAARTFVTARRRVLTRLGAQRGSAAELGARISEDVALGRPLLSDRKMIADVQALTIEGMAPALAELDLSRATVYLGGPEASVASAFGVLGRTPTYLDPPTSQTGERAKRTATHPNHTAKDEDDVVMFSELVDPLTQQAPSSRFTLAVLPGYSLGSALTYGVHGFSVAADVGYRLDHETAVGLHLSLGSSSGTYDTGEFVPILHPISIVPLDLGLMLRATAYERLWGVVFGGLRRERVTDEGVATWYTGVSFGLEGGVDLAQYRGHGLTGFARVESEFGTASYAAFTVGLGYRH